MDSALNDSDCEYFELANTKLLKFSPLLSEALPKSTLLNCFIRLNNFTRLISIFFMLGRFPYPHRVL